MKRNFWLILAVLSLLGMIIMPSTAHSAVIAVPTALPPIDVPRITLPSYPISMMSLQQPQVRLIAPQLRVSLVPAVVPTVVAAAPVVIVPVAMAQAPVMDAPKYPVVFVAQSAIPHSRIEGISAGRKAPKSAGASLSRMTEDDKGSRLSAPARIAALFDGTKEAEPAAVPVGSAQTSPADATEDTSMTLPESDLAEEIGLGY